ncbi:MAG: 1-acyl-sn-glycerol-3-phosphate acyltransferase [Lamprocystis purpurea]|nr:1-acyl-sn-glycerol-3-phosphate acyltransferase [Lamprocystis purpurea]
MEERLTILRSFIYLVYLILSVLFFGSAIVVVGRFLSYRRRSRLAQLWAKSNLGALRLTCGLGYRVSGWELLPATNAIVLCKHQSAWETIALRALLPVEQTWVLKKELLRLPLFGAALNSFSPIAIDRAAGMMGMKRLLKDGKKSLTSGKWVIVFPEGTRVRSGERRAYNIGGAVLAERSGYPVVPIAHNAGMFWGRQSILKRPGKIDLVIGPEIVTQGKAASQINREAEDWIESTTSALERKGLTGGPRNPGSPPP